MCCARLQKVVEAEHLEVVLPEHEVIYYERGYIVRGVSPSTSDQSSSMSVPSSFASCDSFGADPT
jgi:hypothetical protein